MNKVNDFESLVSILVFFFTFTMLNVKKGKVIFPFNIYHTFYNTKQQHLTLNVSQ